MSFKKHDREGYVLVMTLVLIVIAALSMAGLARRSLQLATEAIEAEEALQCRWGAKSIRELMLNRADEHFYKLEEAHLESNRPWPSPSLLEGSVTLGGLDFRLWLADEESKLNLNTLEQRYPEQFNELLRDLAGIHLSPRLLPDRSQQARQRRNWYQSWGQVYELASVFLEGRMNILLAATREITCWGSGRVNVWRASDQLLNKIVSRELDGSLAQKFLAARQEAVSRDLEDLLAKLAVRRSKLLSLRRWLTEESRCYSLWVAIDDGKRTRYHLWVKGDRNAPANSSYLAFHW